jgi:hypothetical protein
MKRMSISPAFQSATLFHDGPRGLVLLGVLPERDQELLQSTYEVSLRELKNEWERGLARKETFWINLWQRSGDGKKVRIDRSDELDAWAHCMAEKVYSEDSVVLDGYGWIVNPMGSQVQEWHIDYSLDYSDILIPLSPLTANNSTQYVVLPPSISKETLSRATADLDRVDLGYLVEKCDYVSVRQLLAKPFSVIRLDFETIHRAVSNTGDFHRTMFWIAVKKKDGELLPEEPLVEIA